MDTLPQKLRSGAGDQSTRLSCPDCSGVLVVRAEGRHAHLRFICRVGHVYSVSDLLVAKEERLEDRLWAAAQSMQELADLVRDLAAYAERLGLRAAHRSFVERGDQAHVQADALRRIINENRAIELDDEAAGIRGEILS